MNRPHRKKNDAFVAPSWAITQKSRPFTVALILRCSGLLLRKRKGANWAWSPVSLDLLSSVATAVPVAKGNVNFSRQQLAFTPKFRRHDFSLLAVGTWNPC